MKNFNLGVEILESRKMLSTIPVSNPVIPMPKFQQFPSIIMPCHDKGNIKLNIVVTRGVSEKVIQTTGKWLYENEWVLYVYCQNTTFPFGKPDFKTGDTMTVFANLTSGDVGSITAHSHTITLMGHPELVTSYTTTFTSYPGIMPPTGGIA